MTTSFNQWLDNWFACFSDEKGGFHERLDKNGQPIDLPKRLLTQCRQMIVYAMAQESDPSCDYLSKLEEGFDFIQSNYFVRETGGFVFSIDRDGQVADHKYDLYAHAFVLLMCAHYMKVSDNSRIKHYAKTTLNFIKDNFRLHGVDGFAEALDKDLNPLPEIRRQNPHMHLMEACLAMYESSQDEEYLKIAEEMLILFFKYFFDEKTKTLGEFFENDLTPHKKEGHIVEAGHHAEWVWLLHRYKQLSHKNDPRIDPAMSDLFSFVLKHGVDEEYGGIYNAQGRQGNVLDSNKRIWCGLEAMRAAAIMGHKETLETLLALYEEHYIDFETGHWHEVLNQDLSPKTDYMPGTTPYHIYPVLLDVEKYREE